MLIQFISLYLVDIANTRNADALIGEALITTVQSFHNRVSSRNEALMQAGSLLSGDFAFKTAFGTGSPRTIESALQNHRRRIGADLMLLLDLSGNTISASGSIPDPSLAPGTRFPFPDFIRTATDAGRASGMVYFHDRLYSLIAVPLLTPVPSAWIILGFQIDAGFIKDLLQETNTQISLVHDAGGHHGIPVSTLPEVQRAGIETAINDGSWSPESIYVMRSGPSTYLSYVSRLPYWGGEPAFALIQRDRDAAMQPYFRVRLLLIGISLLALLFSLFGGAAIASSVTRPVKILAGFARDIQRGDYSREVHVPQQDELGQLALAFNDMRRGLFERDKVRNLLGKVMSQEIAEELIKSDLQLGGEEKEITVLFTDLRGFTTLSEKRAPAEVLDFLNEYFTGMTAVIDKYGGVVDKYIGDAIMALFGAPLVLPDHAGRAVACAIEMIEVLEKSNAAFQARGWPVIAMGVGIHTGRVVVGNMGSKDRLNYTAIGDGVNLASRLESVTKEFSVPIVVSEAVTHQAPGFQYTELGVIRVKGKQEAVKIFTPVKVKRGR